MSGVAGLATLLAVAAIAAVALVGVLGRGASNEPSTAALADALASGAAADAAAANLGAAGRAMEAYFAAHGSYAGATVAALRAFDPALDPSVRVVRADQRGYCLESALRREVVSVSGPGGRVALRPC